MCMFHPCACCFFIAQSWVTLYVVHSSRYDRLCAGHNAVAQPCKHTCSWDVCTLPTTCCPGCCAWQACFGFTGLLVVTIYALVTDGVPAANVSKGFALPLGDNITAITPAYTGPLTCVDPVTNASTCDNFAFPTGDYAVNPRGMTHIDAYAPFPNAIVINWATLFVLGLGNLCALDFQVRRCRGLLCSMRMLVNNGACSFPCGSSIVLPQAPPVAAAASARVYMFTCHWYLVQQCPHALHTHCCCQPNCRQTLWRPCRCVCGMIGSFQGGDQPVCVLCRPAAWLPRTLAQQSGATSSLGLCSWGCACPLGSWEVLPASGTALTASMQSLRRTPAPPHWACPPAPSGCRMRRWCCSSTCGSACPG